MFEDVIMFKENVSVLTSFPVSFIGFSFIIEFYLEHEGWAISVGWFPFETHNGLPISISNQWVFFLYFSRKIRRGSSQILLVEN